MHHEIKKISGIECIFIPMIESNSITLQIFVKAGSIYEQRHTNGIAHFLEHLFFKWGKKYPTPKAVAEAVDSFWGRFNAYTTAEEVSYYVKCAPEFALKALDVLWDMMVHASFPVEELEREKGVVIQEYMMYEDDPMSLVLEKWQNFYYGDNSYGRSTIWTIENIKSFTQEMLFDYKNSLYTKDNLIIVVAWNIEQQEVLEKQIATLFSSLPEKKTVLAPQFPSSYHTQKFWFYDKKTEQNHLVISAPGFWWDNTMKYKANILSIILWGNMSSRLFQHVREQQWLCYYIKAVHYANQNDGVFIIRSWLEKGRFEFWKEKIFSEIADVAKGNITQEEFDKAIWYALGQLQMGIESSDEMAGFVWTPYLFYGEFKNLDDIVAIYKSLTLDDIKQVASLLAEENLYYYWIQ